MRYLYSIIRFVPEPVRGEFINLGVVAGDASGKDWHLVHVANFQRATSAGSKQAFRTAREHLDRLDARVAERDAHPINDAWLNETIGASRSVLQLSAATPVSADSAEQAAQMIFERVVLEPAHRPTLLSARAARVALRAAYGGKISASGDAVLEGVTAEIDGQAEAHFDFAVANGHLVQLAKTWSFGVKTVDRVATDVRAWGYSIALIRDGKHGTTISPTSERTYDVPSQVDIEAVYIPPLTSKGEWALERSLRVFNTLGVEAWPVTDANRVANRAAASLKG